LQTYARHQTLLNEITGAALETPDLETMLQRFIVGLEKILSADGYYITLWNEEKQQPVQFISSDEYEDILQTLPESIESGDKTFSQSILDNGHALAIEDIVNTPYISPHIAALFPVRSALGLPLIANSQKLGTLVLGFRETHQFTPDEIEVCDLISRQISLAILKARLDSVTHERAVELGRLYAAAQDMTSSIMDPPALLNKLAHHMVEALEATSGNIVSINSDNSVMQVVAEYWSDEALPGERQSDMGRLYLASDYSTILHAMFAGKTLTMHADTDNLTNIESEQFKEYDIRSMLFVPIMAHGKLFGNIEIWESRRKRDFTLAEIRLAQAMAGHAASIIENVQLIEILEKREAYFRALIDNSAEGVAILDAGGIIRYIAPSEERLTGYSPDEITGQSAFQYIHPQDLPVILKTFAEGVADQGAVRTVEYRLLRKDGVWRNFELTGHNMLDDQHIAGVVVNYRDITERKQAEQSLRESQIRLEAIISTAMNGIITIDSEYKVVLFNPSAERIFDCSASDVIGQSLKKIIPERYRHNHDNHIHDYSETGLSQCHKGLLDTLYGLRANGEEFPMEAFISQSEIDGQKFFTIIFQDITERKQVEDALKASETKFRTLAENIPSVVYLYKNDGDYTMLYLNDSIEALTGYPKTEFLENGLGFFDLYHPDDLPNIPSLRNVQTTHDNQGPFHITYRIRHKSGEWRWVDEWGSGVLDDFGKVQYLEGVMIDITERKRAEEDLRRHAMELETLVAASSALRTAQNVMEMVPILARQALRVVKGTYASIFLLDPESGEFISRGWYSVDAPFDVPLPNEANLRHFPDRGITGRIVATGDIYVTEDIQKDPVILILDGEQERLKDVHGGISLPLRTQEKIIGIMHIWSLNPRIFTETEIRLLIALAETASNAIHRAVLFEQTLQHASELALAYDNTLAGWARALELRDEITEGHTRRVTELTLSLARALGIPESEIIHIRRGALLHDIGKMGIPDSILHKPGAFTVQERIIMEQHTQYAYDMLSSIPFLQPALDIPFCHHEHWDGNGYPRKLKGEQIPLSARIFSIIDVWDALTSDRPYRPAWSKEKTRDYILERTDKQFDPRIVEAFFALDF
jgi:PAS domain S-box-containing protein/putative nucleotidyltransferase with HDIG domain